MQTAKQMEEQQKLYKNVKQEKEITEDRSTRKRQY